MVRTLLGLVEYAENLDPAPRDAIREDERQSGDLQLTNVRILIGQNVWDGCRQFTLASERLRPCSHSIVGNEHALLSFDLGLL